MSVLVCFACAKGLAFALAVLGICLLFPCFSLDGKCTSNSDHHSCLLMYNHSLGMEWVGLLLLLVVGGGGSVFLFALLLLFCYDDDYTHRLNFAWWWRLPFLLLNWKNVSYNIRYWYCYYTYRLFLDTYYFTEKLWRECNYLMILCIVAHCR